jgi:YihY family inner membrane protein
MDRLYEKNGESSKQSILGKVLGLMPFLPAGFRHRTVAKVIGGIRRVESLWHHWIQVGIREDVRRKHRVVARLMRSLILGLFSFEYNQIPVRSAALTYTTILGAIPLIVILSAVAGQFGYIDLLQRFIPYLLNSFNLDLPIDPILGVLEKAEKMNFQAIGLIGSVGLLVSFFLAMSNIELAVDHIWNLRKPRSIWGTVKTYTPFLFLLMLLVSVLGSFLVRFRSLVDRVDFSGVMPVLAHGAGLLIASLTFTAFIWVGVLLLLLVLPNTRVKLLAAVVGASVTTALLFGLTRLFFFFPHLLDSRNNVVLGSLAFVPALLVFIYVTWALILYGAAVAFIYQKLYREGPVADDDADEDKAFHAVETQVLQVLAAIESMAGDIDIPLPGLQENGDARILREPQAVFALALVDKLGKPLAEIERAAMPLQDLGWVRRRATPAGPVFVLKADPESMDLLALHGLLVRLNPSGTSLLRSLNMLEEIQHTLSLLYSKSKEHPPFSLQTARSLGEQSQKQVGQSFVMPPATHTESPSAHPEP